MREPSRRLRETRMAGRRTLRSEMTAAEVALWQMLRNRQLEGRRFRRQHPIGAYVVDFYCASEKLAVELDGALHFTPEARGYDAARTQALETAGVRVIRFENRMVLTQPETVLQAIAHCFRR